MIFVTPTVGIDAPLTGYNDVGFKNVLTKDNATPEEIDAGTYLDAALVIPPRSYYTRSFLKPGATWTDVRIGIFFTLSHLQYQYVNEFSTITTPGYAGIYIGNSDPYWGDSVVDPDNYNKRADLFHFGLCKKQTNLDLESINFAGIRGLHHSNSTKVGGSPESRTAEFETFLTQLYLTLVQETEVEVKGLAFQTPNLQYVGSLGLRFIYNDKTKKLKVRNYKQSEMIVTDNDDSDQMKSLLLDALTVEPIEFREEEFNLESNKDLDTFFLYWPKYQSRLNLHTMGVVVYD